MAFLSPESRLLRSTDQEGEPNMPMLKALEKLVCLDSRFHLRGAIVVEMQDGGMIMPALMSASSCSKGSESTVACSSPDVASSPLSIRGEELDVFSIRRFGKQFVSDFWSR